MSGRGSGGNISLFVGNVSKYILQKDLEQEFGRFGSWKVNHRGSYAFVEFVEERDAEDAKMVLNNKNLGGLSVNIEWSKRSGNYNPKESIRNQLPKDDKCFNWKKSGHHSRECKEGPECYECGSRGHIAKECNRKVGRERERSRSPRPAPHWKRSPGLSPHISTHSDSEASSYSLDYNPLEIAKNSQNELVFPSDVK